MDAIKPTKTNTERRIAQLNDGKVPAADKARVVDATADGPTVTVVPQEIYPSENPPPYLKLIADCWEHIFDYLALSDIVAMSQTCKRLLQMAGWYFRKFFPKFHCYLIGRNVHIKDGNFKYRELQSDFYRFIGTLVIRRIGIRFHLNADDFSALKTLIFESQDKLNETQIEYTRRVMNNIEEIQLNGCRIMGNIFEMVADYSPKLKYLAITQCTAADAEFNSLFLQRYAALEQLRYLPMRPQADTCIDQFKVFLKTHTKLKYFETKGEVLLANRAALIRTNSRLDVLYVHFSSHTNAGTQFDQFIDLLHTVYERGFYQTLCLSFFCHRIDVDFERVSNALAMLPALKQVNIADDSIFDVARLTDLTELCVRAGEIKNLINAAMNLVRLERLVLVHASSNDIRPFIRYAKRLKVIRVQWWKSGDTLDLFAMNQERRKLAARPILLYLPEHVYLAAKWDSRNLCADLVKIRRLDTNDSISFCYY